MLSADALDAQWLLTNSALQFKPDTDIVASMTEAHFF